jgi:RNA polymerase sigma-70 factor (ECF subfamily)
MMLLEKNATPTNDSAKIDRWSALLAAVPHLRAFARLLRGDLARADILVQEVIVHARATTRHFLPGNDLKLWLFSLAHRLHHRDLQRAGARHDALAGAGTHEVPGMSCQGACCASHGFSLTFSQLHDEEREALILIEAADLTYAEAASVCDCPIDTIRSRVCRARGRLLQTLVVGAA